MSNRSLFAALVAFFTTLTALASSRPLARVKDIPVRLQGGSWVSDWVEVELPPGLRRLHVLVSGSKDQTVQVTDLIDPDGLVYVSSGSAVLNARSLPLLRNVVSANRSIGVVAGSGSLIVPNSPRLPPPRAGRWKLRTLSHQQPARHTVDVEILGTFEGEAPARRLPMRVWVSPNSYWSRNPSRVDAMLKSTIELYRSLGLDLEITSQKLLPLDPPSPVDPPEDVAVLARTLNDANVVNVYLMGLMKYQDKAINGLACLGGPIGFQTRHGCFVSMFASDRGDEITPAQQAKILVHELGHYLGLFHTKDSGYMFIGDVLDPFEDTPEQITGSNMMDPGIHDSNPHFSPEQIEFLKFSPVLR